MNELKFCADYTQRVRVLLKVCAYVPGHMTIGHADRGTKRDEPVLIILTKAHIRSHAATNAQKTKYVLIRK